MWPIEWHHYGLPWVNLKVSLLFETFVSIHHGGSRLWWCAGGVIRGVVYKTLVVVDVGWSQLRSSWRQQYWLYGSLLMIRTALHARCATVVPSATMRVQHYAGSGIKRGTRRKCSSGWQAICLRYSYNRPIFQLIQSVARVSRR